MIEVQKVIYELRYSALSPRMDTVTFTVQKQLNLLEEYCTIVGASSTSVEEIANCTSYMNDLEIELDATINVLNIQNELQRKTLARTKAHCEESVRQMKAKMDYHSDSTKPVEADPNGKENRQDNKNWKAMQIELIARGYTEDLDDEEERANFQKEIENLSQHSQRLKYELASYHDLPPSIPEARAMLQKLKNRRS